MAIAPALLRASREHAGLTYEDLADAMGVSVDMVEYWESPGGGMHEGWVDFLDGVLEILDLDDDDPRLQESPTQKASEPVKPKKKKNKVAKSALKEPEPDPEPEEEVQPPAPIVKQEIPADETLEGTRKRLGLTITQMAQALDVKPFEYATWEHSMEDSDIISASTVERLLRPEVSEENLPGSVLLSWRKGQRLTEEDVAKIFSEPESMITLWEHPYLGGVPASRAGVVGEVIEATKHDPVSTKDLSESARVYLSKWSRVRKSRMASNEKVSDMFERSEAEANEAREVAQERKEKAAQGRANRKAAAKQQAESEEAILRKLAAEEDAREAEFNKARSSEMKALLNRVQVLEGSLASSIASLQKEHAKEVAARRKKLDATVKELKEQQKNEVKELQLTNTQVIVNLYNQQQDEIHELRVNLQAELREAQESLESVKVSAFARKSNEELLEQQASVHDEVFDPIR